MNGTDPSAKQIIVFGAGAYGQALAAAALESGQSVLILAPNEAALSSARANPRLSSCSFKAMDLVAESDPLEGWNTALVLMVVPCQSLRAAATWLSQRWKHDTGPAVVSASKGVEQSTLLLPHDVLGEVLPQGSRVAVLSGPSFAKELSAGMMTSVVCASSEPAFTRSCAERLHRPNFRVYGSHDVVGVEVGGALKNVIAMVAGAVDELKLGHNARSAVITRGLGEITQVGVALGADPLTFLGLSGLGDLVLTCTGDLSRNRTFGMRLAKGERARDIIADLGQVVEGYTTTQSAYGLSRKHQLDTPIVNAVYSVLYEDVPVKEALQQLMSREQRLEFSWARGDAPK